MAVDYDLVIIGGSAIARYAALRAARLEARVALVELTGDASGCSDVLSHAFQGYAIAQAGRLSQSIRQGWQWGWERSTHPQAQSSDLGTQNSWFNWQEFLSWSATSVDNLLEENQHSIALLAAAGVDVIQAQGEFRARPALGFVVKTEPVPRLLRSRSYLLALPVRAVIPAIQGLVTSSYFTLDSLWCSRFACHGNNFADNFADGLPPRLVILGHDLRAIEIAQALNRLGVHITIVTTATQLFPDEDKEVSDLLQIQLESEGIEILMGTIVTRVEEQNGMKQLSISKGRNESNDGQVSEQNQGRFFEHTHERNSEQILETDALLIAIAHAPMLEHLNLQEIDVNTQVDCIGVNRKLQTSNPRVYACGDCLGGYSLLHLGQYEADIAIQNALFRPTVQVNYRQVPWAIFTDPAIARVGLTQAQAQRRYGSDLIVLHQSCKGSPQAVFQGQPTGFCKLLARRNGEIVGAHAVGITASEFMPAIALAMQNNLTLSDLCRLSVPYPWVTFTASELLQPMLQDWQTHQLKPWQRFLSTAWLNFCRDRT